MAVVTIVVVAMVVVVVPMAEVCVQLVYYLVSFCFVKEEMNCF